MQTQLTNSTLTQMRLPTPLEWPIPESLRAIGRDIVVPRERLELSLLSKTDFESAASTDSATEARWARSIGRQRGAVNCAGRAQMPGRLRLQSPWRDLWHRQIRMSGSACG